MDTTHNITRYRIPSNAMGMPYLPRIDPQKLSKNPVTLFDLSSHKRALDALSFGLQLRQKGFHIFVVGNDCSGRMTATIDYLNDFIQTLPEPKDWVYLYNFKEPHKPLPFALPRGKASRFKKVMHQHLVNLEIVFQKTFSSASYLKQVDDVQRESNDKIHTELQRIQSFAASYGLTVMTTDDGFQIQPLESHDDTADTTPLKTPRQTTLNKLKDQLNRLGLFIEKMNRSNAKQLRILQELLATNVSKSLWAKLCDTFEPYLGEWLSEFQQSVLENISLFLTTPEEKSSNHYEMYTVNVLVDHQKRTYPRVFMENMPSLEYVFGTFKYRLSAQGHYETHFSMIRPGSLHRANGGILVLRAEALAHEPEVWEALKCALRDKVIRIRDPQREMSTASLIDAPSPRTIPLDVQVVIVGSPFWYYNFFYNDPDFRAFFKIKADITDEMDITPENLDVFARLILQYAHKENFILTEDALQYLMSCSARWSKDRTKLSARFELIEDVLNESHIFATHDHAKNNTQTQPITIQLEHIEHAFLARRFRNSVSEDESIDSILKGTTRIDTQGSVIGQINGLTTSSIGDHIFGMPARISAQTYAGQHGVMNIERLTEMGGPIQQKGAFILDGFLQHLFAQNHPPAFTCSLTFEQNYHDVEGDSASLAELCAILSSLSGIPLYQHFAVTGSIDQFGQVQAVGGIHHKIEGFFEVCDRRHNLSTFSPSPFGVIIPKSNINNLTIRDALKKSIEHGHFHIYAVETVWDALSLLMPPAPLNPVSFLKRLIKTQEHIPLKDYVIDKIHQKLSHYHARIMGG